MARQHLPHDTSQRPLICSVVDASARAERLLGRHVRWRADGLGSIGNAGLVGFHLRNAEVENLHEVRLAGHVDQEHVSGRQIAMNDSFGVDGSHGCRDLPGDSDDAWQR